MRFVGGKLLHLAVVLMAVTVLTFAMLDLLPASTAHAIAGPTAAAEDIAAIQKELGLDDPSVVRYGRWLAGALRGELGTSHVSGQPVAETLASHLPVTVELIVLAQLFALLLAVPVAILSAWRAESRFDRFFTTLGFGLTSVPSFALAVVLVYVFSLQLKWLPATGFVPLSAGIWPNLKGLLLPALSIALVEWVILMRVLRSELIATLQEDFILLARAKGLPDRKILLRHALRPSLFGTLTVFGLQIGNLIGGAVIIEQLFALPGVGRLLVSSIFAQDLPMVQGCVLLITLGYVAINFLVDVGYGLLDPRLAAKAARSG